MMKRALAKEILDFGHKATQVAEKLLESDADSEGEFEESSMVAGYPPRILWLGPLN